MISRPHPYTIKRFLRFVGAASLLLLLFFLIALFFVRTFTIQEVIVDAPGMTIELDTNRFGKNLFFLPIRKLRSELLTTYPLLSDVRFEKRFPTTLIVHLVRRATFALLTSSGSTYALDETGLILGASVEEGVYPVLIFDGGILSLGSQVSDPRVISSLSFLRGLNEPWLIRSIVERDRESLLAKMEHTDIFLPQLRDLSQKAATLQTIMEGFRIKGTLPTVIDLRFDKPIITN